MKARTRTLIGPLCILLSLCLCAGAAAAQKRSGVARDDNEFGPIVRAYLGYLRNQQEVVDDRISRSEVDRAYYTRNSNRIRALRQMAIRIARETENDFLPELEAVAADEFGLIFDEQPKPQSLEAGKVLNYQFRFLGAIASGRDKFYIFARLDPYEQTELRKQGEAQQKTQGAPAGQPAADSATTVRPRRATSP